MKTIIASLFLVLGVSSAHALSNRLLDCNPPGGPDQQVTVLNNNGSLVLVELTFGGSEKSRPLSLEEWQSKALNLYDKNTRLSMQEDGRWHLEYLVPTGWDDKGRSDCE
jgi:hypothetical protein